MVEARQNICLALFLALSFGVLVNVMILQPRTAATMAAGKPRAGGSNVTQTNRPAIDFATPAAISGDIQRELARLGYLPSQSTASEQPADPLRLHAAILNFQLDAGQQVSGAADDAVLAQLILQHGTPDAARPAPRQLPAGSEAAKVVRAIQTALRGHGYTIRRVDGHITDETLRAIREFEMDRGLKVTGRISADLVQRLQEPTARG